MDWYFENPFYLILLLLLLVIGWVIVRFNRWRNKRKDQFADSRFQDELFERDGAFSKLFFPLYILAFTFLIFSIVDLMKGSEEMESKQKMNNVIFLLDVSNSMNAEDTAPNRLTEAKNIILNSMNGFKNDRVGIIVFAGGATSIMPLTTDYTAAETYLSGVETEVVKIQGTDFLRAMEVAVMKFKNISKGARKVVLISDGEDNEGNENAAIKLAKSEGISVTTVGVGSEDGAPVPMYLFGQLMGYKLDRNGETVLSKRQTEALKKIANATDGIYIDGNNLDSASKQVIQNVDSGTSFTTQMIKSYNGIHYYQYFLGISLFFFLLIYIFNPKRDLNI